MKEPPAREVWVTGLGALTPLGIGVAATWDGVIAGRSGVGPITLFDASALPVRFAGEVPGFEVSDHLDRKVWRQKPRFQHFALVAGLEAWRDSGLDRVAPPPESIAVCIGTGVGGYDVLIEQDSILREQGPRRVSPFSVNMYIGNMGAAALSMLLGAKGRSECVVTACATGNTAISDGLRWIQRGEADVVLAGSAEAALIPIGVASFAAARALSTRNDEPRRASRPFDADRDGFVIAEGAGVLVLEARESAERRRREPYAILAGAAQTADAHHPTAPPEDGEGLARAISNALRDAAIDPAEVGYVNAHGSSTPYNDRAETRALHTAFGVHARRLAVSSTKSMTGHAMGAAGGIEAVATVLALHRGVLPPTINLDHPDPECDLDYIPHRSRAARVEVAISNAAGFGGHNAVLVFRRAG